MRHLWIIALLVVVTIFICYEYIGFSGQSANSKKTEKFSIDYPIYPAWGEPYRHNFADLQPGPPSWGDPTDDDNIMIANNEQAPAIDHSTVGALTPRLDFDQTPQPSWAQPTLSSGVSAMKPLIDNNKVIPVEEAAADLNIAEGDASTLFGKFFTPVNTLKQYVGMSGLSEYADGDVGGDAMPTLGTAQSSYQHAPDQVKLWQSQQGNPTPYMYSSDEFGPGRQHVVGYTGDHWSNEGLTPGATTMRTPFAQDNLERLGDEENYVEGHKESVQFIDYMNTGALSKASYM